MRKLFSTMYGSHLYGTSTPESDIDWKYVVLPDLDSLLLGKKLVNEVKKTNKQAFTKNTSEDLDEEFIPIQIFARDFLGGQTYALEIAFAVESTHAGQTIHDPLFLEFVRELRARFLTSNIKALAGFATNQALVYSTKGERLNAVRATLDVFQQFPKDAKVSEHTEDFKRSMMNVEMEFVSQVMLTNYDRSGKGDMAPCVNLLGKILPFSATFGYNLTTIEALRDKYGSRADAASTTKADWKATMHARRVIMEGIDLLTDHSITFPYSHDTVEELLSIKQGGMPYEEVMSEINAGLDFLDSLSEVSRLPKADAALRSQQETWLLPWLRRFYNLPSHSTD